MSTLIDISKMNKAEVLASLYNNAQAQGLGFFQHTPEPMGNDEAQEILDSGQTYFDYLKGRVMKVDLSESEFDPWLYDRDNGSGAAQDSLNHLAV